jgi:thioredoxin reductase (NADPH)
MCLRDTVSGEASSLPVDGIFIAIGHKPNSELFAKFLATDESGYLKTLPYSSHTTIPGVFLAGDVADSIYRQAVTAAGTGCMAAIDAERFLEAEGH